MEGGLFKQYEAEYCTKSTELSKNVESVAALSAGGLQAVGARASVISRPVGGWAASLG